METIDTWADWFGGMFNTVAPGSLLNSASAASTAKNHSLTIGNILLILSWNLPEFSLFFFFLLCPLEMSALCYVTALQRLSKGTLSPWSALLRLSGPRSYKDRLPVPLPLWSLSLSMSPRLLKWGAQNLPQCCRCGLIGGETSRSSSDMSTLVGYDSISAFQEYV